MNRAHSVLVRNTAYLFLCCVFFIYACTGSKQTVKSDKDFPGDAADSLVAYIERSRCFGVCPVYSTKIYRSGYVLYEGKDHVQNIGRFYTWLSHQQLVNIGVKAEETGYFELMDEYRNPHLTDFPTIYSEVRFRGKRKKITCYHSDPPDNLVEVQDYIDGLFNAETKWIMHPVQKIEK